MTRTETKGERKRTKTIKRLVGWLFGLAVVSDRSNF